MPTFDFKCECGYTIKDAFITGNTIPKCPKCWNDLTKDYTNMRVAFKPDIPEHFNESLGMVVKSRRDLRDKLFLTNSRTEDIDPTGGLTKEERAIRSGESIPILNKTIFDKRKEPLWANNPQPDVYIDD